MSCPCDVNPDQHECRWVRPWEAAALVGRPIETIHTWRKSGKIASRKDSGPWEVCCCEALSHSDATFTKWRKRANVERACTEHPLPVD